MASRIFRRGTANFSRPIVRFGIISVVLGLSVMILAVAIVTGFQQQVREKVIGFGAHIQISGYETSNSMEAGPIPRGQTFLTFLNDLEDIRHIQIFAQKAGIVKTENQIEGVVLKGVGTDFDWSYFENKITDGRLVQISDSSISSEILISGNLARKLEINSGDPIRMYFINNDELQPRGRKFTVAGVYETGLEEFDNMYVIGDIRQIQRLNGWNENQVGGFEIFVEDFNQLEKTAELLYDITGPELRVRTIRQLYPQIFDWLDLHDMNVIIILSLMVLVAGITMISTLLILILEKTNMIGTLKAMGTKNRSIRLIFLINAVYIIGQGLIWGNLLAIGLSLLQLQTGIFKLDETSYYISEVPINMQLSHYLLINAGTLIVCTLILIVPTYIITRISPVRAIRLD